METSKHAVTRNVLEIVKSKFLKRMTGFT